MKSEFALAFNEVLEDKQLPREVILSALESAMIAAYRKSVGASAAQNVKVTLTWIAVMYKSLSKKKSLNRS